MTSLRISAAPVEAEPKFGSSGLVILVQLFLEDIL